MAGFEGLDPMFGARLRKMIADSGGRIWLNSGFRSVERQAQLYDEAVRKYGEAGAGKWVAPPGKSNHNHGRAGDLGFTDEGREWAHANAHRYGLHFPMSWEPWHIEPLDTAVDPNFDAYTEPPLDHAAIGSPEQLNDPAYQMTKILAILDQDVRAAFDPAASGPDIAAAGSPLDVSAGGGRVNVPEGGEAMGEFGFRDNGVEEVVDDGV